MENDEYKSIQEPLAYLKRVSRPPGGINYNNTNKNIGFALVFNQINFKSLGLKKRIGSQNDTKLIEKALNSYGFKVKVCVDYTKNEIFETLSDYSAKDHSENDCFVVVVMSHGQRDEIFATAEPYKVEKLWEPFLGEKCKSLINKPKLFFIQSCRGESIDHGAKYQTDSIDTPRTAGMISESEKPIGYHIPHTADLFVYYSTFKDHPSYIHPIVGTIFIQTLAEVLEEFAKDVQPRDLYFLVTQVTNRVAYEYQIYYKTGEKLDEKQMPCFESTLTKLFLLKPRVEKL